MTQEGIDNKVVLDENHHNFSKKNHHNLSIKKPGIDHFFSG